MKLNRTYKGIGHYYTLDGNYRIEKLRAINLYSIRDMKTNEQFIASDFNKPGFGTLLFSTIKEATDFLKENFYKEA
jgi:hypothetical protein